MDGDVVICTTGRERVTLDNLRHALEQLRGPRTLEEALKDAYDVDAVYFSVLVHEIYRIDSDIVDPRRILIIPKRQEEPLRLLWGDGGWS